MSHCTATILYQAQFDQYPALDHMTCHIHYSALHVKLHFCKISFDQTQL
jgi:hypothetical protein